MRSLILVFTLFSAMTPCLALDEYWMPVVDGEFWSVAGNPNLGKYTTQKQQPVDFAVWQAADGTWQLWSCIRGTDCGGNTRLFHRWEGENITDPDWRPMGIAMEAKPELGEREGGLQAPHVVKHDGLYWMTYGSWANICFATSKDGKHFERVIQSNGKTSAFSEGGLANTRDAQLIKINNLWHCYYTGSDDYLKNGYVYCRTSPDLKTWSNSFVVNHGGQAGTGPWSHECPHVIEIEPGFFCLFRNQNYKPNPLFTVYCSNNPLNFGIGNDIYRIGTMPYAAPEVVYHDGKYYLAVLKANLDGIKIARLKWLKIQTTNKKIFDYDASESLTDWKITGGDLKDFYVPAEHWFYNAPMKHFITTGNLMKGKFQDQLTCTIESPEFKLDKDRYTLFVAGGKDPENLYVALVDVASGEEILKFTGKKDHSLKSVQFQSGKHKDKKVRIRIVDRSTEEWGRISFGGIYESKIVARK